MAEQLVAPASLQQIDLLRKASRVPESAPHFDGVLLLKLDGSLDVAAMVGALEALVERHQTLRTTVRPQGATLVQEVHPAMLVPVRVTYPTGVSLRDAAYEACTNRFCGVEAAAGAPLFRAELAVLDGSALLTLRIHHLITDGWSDGVLLRDLVELYRARVEGRDPKLPELPLTYVDFARQQHAEWSTLGAQVLERWRAQLEGYPGPVRWPSPAEEPADPYECAMITRDLDAQLTLGVRMAAREWRVPPFLVLIAGTATAIGEVTGQYDLLVGSNVANREAREKRELIGYVTNTRVMRLCLDAQLSIEAVTALVREQWLAGDEFREIYMDQVLDALGIIQMVKIDSLEFPPALTGGPKSGELVLTQVGLAELGKGRLRHWRDLNITWLPIQDGFQLEVRYRRAAIDPAIANAIADRTVAVLSQLMQAEAHI